MKEGARHITGLDMAPNQIHLLRLKLAVAQSSLTTEQAVDFLLRGENGKQVLSEELSQYLPVDSLDFFSSEAQDEMEAGIFRIENDNPFNIAFRRELTTNHGIDLTKYHTMSDAERARVITVCEMDDAKGLFGHIQDEFNSAAWFAALPEPV